jgi:hypothetical protein
MFEFGKLTVCLSTDMLPLLCDKDPDEIGTKCASVTLPSLTFKIKLSTLMVRYSIN